MTFVYSPRYEIDIGGHIFPSAKYRLVREKLLAGGAACKADFLEPEPLPRSEIELVHKPEFVDDLLNNRWTHRTNRSEMPLSPAIAQAYLLAAAGTTLAAQTALASPDRVCVHLGGGFHHAFPGHAEGFCYINDIAIAIRILQRRGIIARALVIDCDLHQGNGTAHIFAKDPDVFTISIHQENLYPQKVCSDIDVGLDDFTGDDEYLEALKRAYPPSLEKHNPALIIFVAGADPYEDDQIGSLQLTKPGLLARDEMVFGHAHRLGIPIIVVLAGGYARNIADTVDIHTQTCHAAMRHCH